MNAPFAPGDRVLVEGEFRCAVDGTFSSIHFSGNDGCEFVCTSDVHPIPTPVSHLRAASQTIIDYPPLPGVNSLAARHYLHALATHLESSAAPKPPTLADELREARTTLSIIRTQVMVEHNRGVERWEGVPEKLKERLDAIDEALAREPGAAT